MSAAGLRFNVSFDASVASAPTGFLATFAQALKFFEDNFNVPVTVNLDVGWGEVRGNAIAPGALGENIPAETSASFSQVQAALIAKAAEAGNAPLIAALRTADPTNGGQFVASNAEAKALGLIDPNTGGTDGWIGFSSARAYTFDPDNRSVPGAYDFLGVAEHEISEVLGRYLFAGAHGEYTPLDLMRYSAPGVRDVKPGNGSYLSFDGGNTVVNRFNGAPGFDPGDWAGYTLDAFNAYLARGHEVDVSAGDIAELQALGYGGPGDVGTAASGAVMGAPGQIIKTGGAMALVNAMAGNQAVVLGSGDASVFGGAGDTVVAGAGNAYIDGLAGGMWIITGTAGGFNTIFSGHGDTISGVAADFNIIGAAGDVISTGAGNGTVNAMAGNEAVTMGSGDVSVFGGVGDTIVGGPGKTYIDGRLGHMSITGGSGTFNTIFSGPGDTIVAGAADGNIFGAAGDTITTGSGSVIVNVMPGHESLTLGPGNATVYSGVGDTITAGASNAMILGGFGDSITGGSGTTIINGLAGGERIVLGSGPNSVFGGVADTIVGGSGSAYIDGTAGHLWITAGSGGSDTIFSGVGDTILGGAAATQILGAFGDVIQAGSGNATINGMAGGESITLGNGPSTVFGGAADTIVGAAGSAYIDFIAGHPGAEYLKAGNGDNRAAQDTVFNFNQAAGDRIIGESAPQITAILATQHVDQHGNTIVQLHDGSTITFVGIHHLNNSFFG